MYSEIAANKRKTVIIFTLFIALAGVLAWLFGKITGSPNITTGVIIGGIVYALISYFSAARMAIAINRAHRITKKDEPRLWRTVENLSITEGLPMPRVYIMEDPAPNAFATGRNPDHAIVCATTGLLEMMNDHELEGVIAHELGHVKNYDIRVSMIAFALVAVVGLMADFLLRLAWFGDDDNSSSTSIFLALGIVAAILAPIAASLIQLAISRKREYLADATGALTTRYPEGLASALEKIGHYGKPLKRQNTSTAHMFFVNPLSGRAIAHLFSTHPPVEERIKILRNMGKHQ